MNLSDIRQRLAPLSWSELAALGQQSGVPFHTLRKIASEETADPRTSTVEKLRTFFERAKS
jgi:hypothetical protein